MIRPARKKLWSMQRHLVQSASSQLRLLTNHALDSKTTTHSVLLSSLRIAMLLRCYLEKDSAENLFLKAQAAPKVADRIASFIMNLSL